jgi:hypothetical protein
MIPVRVVFANNLAHDLGHLLATENYKKAPTKAF